MSDGQKKTKVWLLFCYFAINACQSAAPSQCNPIKFQIN